VASILSHSGIASLLVKSCSAEHSFDQRSQSGRSLSRYRSPWESRLIATDYFTEHFAIFQASFNSLRYMRTSVAFEWRRRLYVSIVGLDFFLPTAIRKNNAIASRENKHWMLDVQDTEKEM
jgi:hypothetical protein